MRLLITGAWQQAKEYFQMLQKLGHEICFLQNEQDKLPCKYEWPEGVICNGLFLYHPIQRFKFLRFIQLTSAGFDRVPMDYVREHGIEIHNAQGVYSIPMAEFALAGVLQIYKKARFFYDNQKVHRWEKHRGLLELHGKTVCVVGCGSVGTECAKRFRAFGCRLLGVNRSICENEFFDRIVTMEHLNETLGIADIVVLTLPLTDETYHLMNAARFACMNRGAVLVNIARGAIVDTKALEAALENLSGAVLDVFEDEPLKVDSPLWDKEKVILTPHNSFVGEGNGERIATVIRKNLKEW